MNEEAKIRQELKQLLFEHDKKHNPRENQVYEIYTPHLDEATASLLKVITEARIEELGSFDAWVKDLADDQVYTIVSAFIKTYVAEIKT